MALEGRTRRLRLAPVPHSSRTAAGPGPAPGPPCEAGRRPHGHALAGLPTGSQGWSGLVEQCTYPAPGPLTHGPPRRRAGLVPLWGEDPPVRVLRGCGVVAGEGAPYRESTDRDAVEINVSSSQPGEQPGAHLGLWTSDHAERGGLRARGRGGGAEGEPGHVAASERAARCGVREWSAEYC